MKLLKTTRKERLFGIEFDAISMDSAVEWVYDALRGSHGAGTRYVVTPNVNLTMLHQDSANFRKVVHHADLTIVDGMPLVLASSWLKRPLPERVAGSDLVYSVFESTTQRKRPLRVFLLGAAPGVAPKASSNIRDRWRYVDIVGTLSPEYGFEDDADQNRRILEAIAAVEPDVLVVGLGAPKQETWAYQNRAQINAAVTLCVGATIDFLAGEQKRAPHWCRSNGLEWVWRVCTNPRRLATRYLRDAYRLPRLLVREWSGLCPHYQTR